MSLTVRALHCYQIDDIFLQAYDEAGSLAADWVAWELQADGHHLREMHFDGGDVVIESAPMLVCSPSIWLSVGLPESVCLRTVPGKFQELCGITCG